MKKVFLGGTCNGSKWRKEFENSLEIDFFNPVVDDWDEDAYQLELHERENCDYCLYVITPKMTGVYSIAEVIDDSNKRPEKTVFCYIEVDGSERFDSHQLKSLRNTGRIVEGNGGTVFDNTLDVLNFLNHN